MDRQLNKRIPKDTDSPISVSIRDGINDCFYYGSAVLVNSDGEILWHIGNPQKLVFERSLVKPFRAFALLKTGAADIFDLDEGDIAIIAGSHSGTIEHVERVRKILAKGRISCDKLNCGKRLPLGEDAIWELVNTCTPILDACQCDCSGEHAGILLLCCHLGFSIDNYINLSHPIQRVLKESISIFSSANEIYEPSVIDMCGMPMSAVPLHELSNRFLKLAMHRYNDIYAERLINAISLNPYLYTGKNRLLGEIIIRSNGRIIGKDGAGGIYTFVWLKENVSLTVKVGSGTHRAALPVIEKAAKAVGLDFPNVRDCINNNEFAIIYDI